MLLHQYTSCATLGVGLLVVILSTATTSTSASHIPIIVCPPNPMSSDAPATVRQLCFALLDKTEMPLEEGKLFDAREVAAAAATVGVDPSQLYERHLVDGRGTKRQDVDHVFLRFGRRSGI